MKQKNPMKKWIQNGGVRAITVLLVVVLIVLSVCHFNNTLVPAQTLDQIAEGRSRMSALSTSQTTGDSGFTAEFPDGNNGIHLNLKESDKVPGEEDSEKAEKSDPKGITQGISGNDSVSQESVSQNTKTEEGVVSVNDETADELNEFFYTTINETEILTDVSYSFSIIHLQPELSVESTLVTVNDTTVNNFQGKCRLSQGENTIGVEVTYQKKDKTYVSQKRIYHVQVELNDIAITTNLKDGHAVDQPTFSFSAYAKRKDTEAKLTARLNNAVLTGKKTADENYEYSCELKEGKNQITLTAKDSFGTKSISYQVEYKPAKTNITIETNLENTTVSTASITFTAKAYSDEKKAVKLSVSVNGTKLSGEADSYTAELVEGENTLVLSAGSGAQEVMQSYQVKYVPEVADPAGDDPSLTAPKLETDLVDGSTITGNTLSFYIKPVSYQGERIRGQNVVVTCNDAVIDYVWDDSTTTSYRMTLQDGENKITITPTDLEGNALTFPYTVTCNAVGSGESLGHVTLSIEATTVGLGNIVDSTEVEIFEGVNAAKMLTDLLGEYGYDYSSTGSIDSGFYLSSIKGSGIVENPSVSSDLEERLLEEEGSEYDIEKYNSDSLGEFDFCKGSGWMYSVNGHYPNYGFSDCYPHDGDVIRIRFTLYYGKDIGGGYAMGEGDEDNWGDW